MNFIVSRFVIYAESMADGLMKEFITVTQEEQKKDSNYVLSEKFEEEFKKINDIQNQVFKLLHKHPSLLRWGAISLCLGMIAMISYFITFMLKYL